MRNRDGHFRTPAFKVAVSDTTGCGDAYCGGFVAGLIEGLDLEAACSLGAATAALVATGLGSDAGVIDRAQVEAFMAKADASVDIHSTRRPGERAYLMNTGSRIAKEGVDPLAVKTFLGVDIDWIHRKADG